MSSEADSNVPISIIPNTVDDASNDIQDGSLCDAVGDTSSETNAINDTPDDTAIDVSSTKDTDERLDPSVSNIESISEHVPSYDELAAQLESQIIKTNDYEVKLQHVLADYENLSKKTQADIKNGINAQIDKFILDFLGVYDDFIRAKDAFAQNQVDTHGLDAILKNMDALLKRYDTSPIDALGEIFDPTYHEAISSIINPSLDDGTIVEEVRKGYISQSRVIRPTLVKISKKE